jgi:hypothetical protein
MSTAQEISRFPPMQQTTVRPEAFRQATAVRNLGIGVTGLVSVLSGAMLVALLMILFLAIGMAGQSGPFVPGLAASLVLGGYLAVAPPVFAHRTRASTAGVAGGWLLAALAGYAVLWSVLLAAL